MPGFHGGNGGRGDPAERRVRSERSGRPERRGRNGFSIALLYGLFAAAAIATNLLVQRGVAALWPLLAFPAVLEIYGSLVIGTGAGLLVKYVLDKRYIFRFTAVSFGADVGTFALYSIMGVVTTAIFWGSELLFETLFTFGAARYVGGFVGLSAGYTVKYFLDKRFVFRSKSE